MAESVLFFQQKSMSTARQASTVLGIRQDKRAYLGRLFYGREEPIRSLTPKPDRMLKYAQEAVPLN